MTTQPDRNKDIQVKVVAYADGHDSTSVRVVSNSMVALNADLVLLRSERPLGLKSYPTPAKAHFPPYDSPATYVTRNIGLFSYNGCPSTSELKQKYPNSSLNGIYNAVRDLWMDRLSYGQGTTSSIFDPDGLRHRISCYAGASGGLIVDDNGNALGKILPACNIY